MREIVLGTRGSALALWQARHVARRLHALDPALRIREKIVKTEGDVQQSEPLGPGSVGVFVRRLEQALLSGDIDLAVHSLKDMPTEQPEGLVVTAVGERHEPCDVLLSTAGHAFAELPPGTVIGTGSYRRRAQLLHARPDLDTVAVRGNVETRLRKLREGRFGALVLALAGIERLGLREMPYRVIEVDLCLPAVGQGALGLETRHDDERVRKAVAPLDHPPTHCAVRAERAFLRELGGGCLAPATAFAELRDERLRVRGAVGDPDGCRLLRDEVAGSAEEAEALGVLLAQRMVGSGAAELLRGARERERSGGTE